MANPLNTVDMSSQPTSTENQIFSQIKRSGTSKEQLKKVSTEFEAVFVSQMLNMMDQTVDKEGGAFGGEGNFMKNFKSLMYDDMARDIAKNPRTSFGFAAQIYKQMEKGIVGKG